MSRASKIASARGQAHTARHATNVAREKLRRVTDERDRLCTEVERLRAELAATNALADRLSQQSSEYFMGKERAEKQLAAMQAKEVRK